jgi:hypothetical protein
MTAIFISSRKMARFGAIIAGMQRKDDVSLAKILVMQRDNQVSLAKLNKRIGTLVHRLEG